jgi:hypothetical protein
MASNELTTFQPGQVPAYISGFFAPEDGNTAGGGITVPSLSPQGKVWTISLEGQKTKLEKRDNDGEIVPVGVMKVVILDFAQRRGRTYYEGAYDPDKESAPLCWSDDGITPDSASPQLQAKKCAECPKAVKGSKITDQGKATAACSQHRMLALVPANKLDFAPLRLKIAITSDWDKESAQAAVNTQQGWFAFQNYRDYLTSVGVTHTAQVMTKMKFDSSATYPKILFAADRWLTPEELAQVVPLSKDPEVKKLLGGTWTPAGPDGVKKDDTTAGAGQGVPATEQQVATEAAATADEDDGDGVIMGLDAPAATPTQGAAQAAKPVPSKPKTTTAPKAAAAEVQPEVATVKDPALAALLADWGSED